MASVAIAHRKVKKLFVAFHLQSLEKRLAMFRLTKREQLVVAFLVGALVLGVTVKHWRELHSLPQDANIVKQGR